MSGCVEGVKSMEHPPLKAVVFHNDKGKVLVETVLGVNSKVVVFLGVNNLLVEGNFNVASCKVNRVCMEYGKVVWGHVGKMAKGKDDEMVVTGICSVIVRPPTE